MKKLLNKIIQKIFANAVEMLEEQKSLYGVIMLKKWQPLEPVCFKKK